MRHPDHCEHDRPRDRFLGTVQVGAKFYDVHVYQDNALADTPDMHVCLRYGDKPSEYCSPGNASEFVKRCERGNVSPQYLAALSLVKAWEESEAS